MFSQIHFFQKALVLILLTSPTDALSKVKVLKGPFSRIFERRPKSYKTLYVESWTKKKRRLVISTKKLQRQALKKIRKLDKPKRPLPQGFYRTSCFYLLAAEYCTTRKLPSIQEFLRIASSLAKKRQADFYFRIAATAQKQAEYSRCYSQEKYRKSLRRWRQCCYRKSARYRQMYPKLDLLWFKLAQKYEKKGHFRKAAKWYTLYYLHDRILKGTKLSKSLNKNRTNSVISRIRKQLRKKKALSKAVLLYRKLGNSKLSQLLLNDARQ